MSQTAARPDPHTNSAEEVEEGAAAPDNPDETDFDIAGDDDLGPADLGPAAPDAHDPDADSGRIRKITGPARR